MSTSKKTIIPKSSYHHGNLFDELKKSAIEMLKTQGIARINLRDLATQCCVSATSVYRHYKSKEHLLAVIAQDGFVTLHKAMLEASEPNKLQNMGIAYIHFALENPVYFQLMFGPFLEKKKYPALFNASNEAFHLLRTQVEQSILQGIMIGNVDSLARIAWATVHGTAVLLLDNQFNFNNNNQLDSNQIAIEVTTALCQGIYTG